MNEDTINLVSPGPYVWGIIKEGPSQLEWVQTMLGFGSGDIHLVILPGHPDSSIGADPQRPEHAVTLCMTGNGPNSANNARAIACLLTCRDITKADRKPLPIPTTPDAVAWAEYAVMLEHALGIADPVPENLRNWRPFENGDTSPARADGGGE